MSEVSTTCPRPVMVRRYSAASAPWAANIPASESPSEIARRGGGPPGNPFMCRRPTGRLGDRGVPGLARVRTGLPVPGYAHQDDARLASERTSCPGPLLQEVPGRKFSTTMSERLIRSRNAAAPSGSAQIEGDGLLVAGVDGPHEVVTVDLRLAPRPDRVGLPGRLDLDDLGAHVAEEPAREGPEMSVPISRDADSVECAGCHGGRLLGVGATSA